MATEITMPKLSDTMTEGRLGSWKKGVGEAIQRGDVIAEVETDKAVMDLEAFTSGILLEQRIKAGELVPVGTVIGLIGAPGEVAQPVAPSVAESSPVQAPVAQAPVSEEPAATAPAIVAASAVPHEEQSAPVVRRKARELGIDLAQVPGSGPGGRVLLEDLERFMGVRVTATPPAAEPAAAAAEAGPATEGTQGAGNEQPLSRMRAAVARTVERSWQSIPHFYVTIQVAMDAAEEIRRELKENGTPVSVNDLVLKGAALALVKYPQANASFAGDRLILHQEVNLGLAVSLPAGLLVPVLRGCQSLSLLEIAGRSRALAEKARSGRLNESELGGGTFTVSNLGMYGVHEFAAVILPPQAAILAVGAVRETVVVRQGQPAVGKVLNLTLSADHRVLDGAYGAEFLRELRQVLENPVKLLL